LACRAAATPGGFVVVEDHYAEGGLGSAVLEALARRGVSVPVHHLPVRNLPGSGPQLKLFEQAGIAPGDIVAAARDMASTV
jgi:transketolase